MRSRLLLLVALTLVLVAVLGGVAYGQTYLTPDDCYTCHGVTGTGAIGKVDFDVPAVDYAKCATCHSPLVGASFGTQHWHTLNRCADCHASDQPPAITDSSRWFFGMYTSPISGVFRTSASLLSSPQALHEAHSGAGWVNSLTFARSANCQPCHKPATCSSCHVDSVAHTDHAVADYPAVSYLQATGTGTTTEPSTCVNSACHDPAKAATPEFVPWCGTCHPARVEEHGYDTIDHVADDGSAEGIACSACHALDLATAHGDPGAAGASCATCHPMPRKSFDAWDQTCATGGCHTAASTAPMHADTTTAHQVDAANQLCLDCHTGTELGSIHAGAETTTGETSCLVCHTASSTPVSRDCTVCHFTFDAHYDEAAHQSTTLLGCSGDGCHAVASGLMTVHEERNAAFGCFGCHNSIRTAVQDAIATGDTSCGACHGSVSGLGGHRDAHWPTPLLKDAAGPHYSYYTGSVGEFPTTDCMMCHTQNLVDEHMGLTGAVGNFIRFPQLDDAGNPLTCGTCHDQPAGSTVQNAIAAGLSACESCHPVHGPINPIHTSTFVDDSEVPCGDCHSANLTMEHNGGYKSTAGLAGCDVCHNLYTGMTSGPVTGDATQAAISTSNDTRCSACHTSYHTDSVSHDASDAASLACGTCHAVGQTVIDVSLTSLHPTCATCHKSTRIGDISTHTAECASCHSAEGTDYHEAMDASHEYYDMGASCQSCHANTLPEEHEAYLGRYPAYDTTCALCHENPAFDVTTRTAACSSCHEIHGDIPTLHTATASEACVRCHGSADLRVLHGDTMDASCVTCHNATFSISGKTAECTSCHAVEGTDYHAEMSGVHAFETMDVTCQAAGCHASTLPEEHAKYLSRYPTYSDTCALCHLNANSARIDWSTASADCSTCHTLHGDIAVAHTATASQACVDCHETADTRQLHGTSADASCPVCHGAPAGRIDWTNPSIECVYCHSTRSPVDPSHYPTSAHAATPGTGCTLCHSMDMKAEHFKSTVAVSCVACHEQKVDAFTAPWDKSCTACHPTKHENQAIAHKSTNTACTGTGCHVVTDVSVLHGTNCAACHAAGVTASTNCTLCHQGSNPHHVTITLKMTTDSTWRTVCGSCHGRTHSMGGCSRCHAPARLHNVSRHVDQNSRCAGCHKVATVDVSKNCLACHASVQGGSSGGSWGGWGR